MDQNEKEMEQDKNIMNPRWATDKYVRDTLVGGITDLKESEQALDHIKKVGYAAQTELRTGAIELWNQRDVLNQGVRHHNKIDHNLTRA